MAFTEGLAVIGRDEQERQIWLGCFDGLQAIQRPAAERIGVGQQEIDEAAMIAAERGCAFCIGGANRMEAGIGQSFVDDPSQTWISFQQQDGVLGGGRGDSGGRGGLAQPLQIKALIYLTHQKFESTFDA